MKRILLMVGASALLVAPFRAQTQSVQTQNDMTIPEFRQVLLDVGSYLDAHKGTNLQSRFEALSSDGIQQMYSAVPNPRQLQKAVAALKQHDSEIASGRVPPGPTAASLDPQAVVGSCAPNTIIDTATGAACTPAYPDSNNTDWQTFIQPLITFGAFSPSDFPSVSRQGCGLKVETNLQQVTVAFTGAVAVASAVCGALPVVATNVCWGVVAVGAAVNAVSAGLYSDCLEQDGLVNAAEIDAGFHNTVTIYNALKAANTQINTEISSLDTHLTNVNTDVDTKIANLSTQLTTVNNQITGEFSALDAHLVLLVTQLTNQITQGTALLGADLRQVMKLEMTPDGQKILNPAILTCTGTNCPNVLANCGSAGCSWNIVGPLP